MRDEPKVSRFEVVGAWLHIWEPPRGAHIPPVPWRTLAVATLGVVLALGAVAAFAIPRIDDAKERSAAREQRALDGRRAARRAAIRAEQQPRRGVASSTARPAVLAAVESAIGADARRRFNRRARTASCEPLSGTDLTADRVGYDCSSAVRDIVGAAQQEGARGALVIPFRAVVDFRTHSYVFCKTNPPPGEQVIPDPRTIIELPRACRDPQA